MSWDYIKSGTSPQQFCQFSNKSARWKCWQCGHEWTAKIRSRVLRQSGCPMCYLSSGQQKLGKRLSSLADSKPAFMAEWHPTMNTKDGIKPENLKLGSSRLAWWSCTKCPKDQPHVWQASPKVRQSSGCPFCAHRSVCACNSLRNLFPDYAAEMDNAENKLSSAQVTAKANINVQWKSIGRGVWMQQIHRRPTSIVKGSPLYSFQVV